VFYVPPLWMCIFFLPSRLNESRHPSHGCVIFTLHSVEVHPPLPHVKVTLRLLECNHTPCAGEGSVINYPVPVSGRRGHHPAHGCTNLVFFFILFFKIDRPKNHPPC